MVHTLPSWQTGFGINTHRNQPDVSFLAGSGFYGALWGICTDQDYNYNTNSPITDCAGSNTAGNNFYLTGVGGTSASSPAFAGMLALAMQRTGSRLGQANYVLYNLAKTKYTTVFHDVTAGNNSVNCQIGTPDCTWQPSGYTFLSGYNTATGYDEATGLGSVDVKQMSSNWASVGLASTTSALQLNGGTAAVNITHGQTVGVNATVSGSNGTPTGDVALVDDLEPAAFPNNVALGTLTLSSGECVRQHQFTPGRKLSGFCALWWFKHLRAERFQRHPCHCVP